MLVQLNNSFSIVRDEISHIAISKKEIGRAQKCVHLFTTDGTTHGLDGRASVESASVLAGLKMLNTPSIYWRHGYCRYIFNPETVNGVFWDGHISPEMSRVVVFLKHMMQGSKYHAEASKWEKGHLHLSLDIAPRSGLTGNAAAEDIKTELAFSEMAMDC